MGIGGWIIGAFIGLLGLSGLFLASAAEGSRTFYVMGLGLLVFACIFIFALIKQSFDERS